MHFSFIVRVSAVGQSTRDLLELLDRLTPTIAESTQAIEQEAENAPKCSACRRIPEWVH
jgi:hypothetical protein